MNTPYHARYFAHELCLRRGSSSSDRLSMALFDACVDLNPHQIDAATFALRKPLSKGVLLADEVGLGKTIEADLVLCQYWAERKRRLLVISPASLRKQWSLDMREQYTLSYMLDVESRGSQSLLNVEAFRNPDEYKLRVERDGETQLVNVDLVETFNWLLGLTVKHIDVIPIKKDGPTVRVVDGTAPNGDRVLVVWRNIDQIDNDALDKWFGKQGYSTREMVYDVFYVNSDNNLENLRRPDQTWKVRLIEEEFKRLMFDVEDM